MGCGPSQPWNPIKTRHCTHGFLRQDKAFIVQRGAEGPDALQGLIRTSISVLDFGGLRSLAAAKPIKAPTLRALLAAKRSWHRPARRRGTGRPPGLDQNFDLRS